MKVFATPDDVRATLDLVVAYEALLRDLKRPRWWFQRAVSAGELLVVVTQLHSARASMFKQCERSYPELKGLTYTVGSREIACESLEDEPLPPQTEAHER